MAESFYPFVQNASDEKNISTDQPATQKLVATHAARIAVYDDVTAAPRVVLVEPKDVRSYLEEITATVSRLAKEQGGDIPFMVIREIVENFIHAYFIQPTISILDDGQTIRFSDQGPGIKEKNRALEFGSSSATEEMKQYIRGVGSGLPYVQQYMEDKGGSLQVDDNINGGTIVTISSVAATQNNSFIQEEPPLTAATQNFGQPQQPPYQQMSQTQMGYPTQSYPQAWAQPYPYPPYGYPAQMPMQTGFVPPAQTAYPAAPPTPAPSSVNASATQNINLTDRARTILNWLSTHDSVGPKELADSYALSQPTWSRELHNLETAGFIHKQKGGQKYFLTEMGRIFLQNGAF